MFQWTTVCLADGSFFLKTNDALDGALRCDVLWEHLSAIISCETFVLEEVMSTENIYHFFRDFLTLFDIATSCCCTKRDMPVLRIIAALFDD